MKAKATSPATTAIEERHPPALDAILGANPFVGIDAGQVVSLLARSSLRLLGRPDLLVGQSIKLFTQLAEVAAGSSDLAPAPNDRRFADRAWNDNPFYRALMQTYLAWRGAIHALAQDGGDDTNGDWRDAAQRRFAIGLLTEALAPTNTLWGNPTALKRAFETGGVSLIRGARNFLDDLRNNRGMPATVDKAPFKVGGNLAVTPGQVIHRGELFEIIQYAPTTARVFERPLVIIPPQINKFYIMDLAPGRSFVEYAVGHGLTVFALSWRNPTPAERDWGLDEYVGACKEAIAIACEVSAASAVNVLGICAGGITTALTLAHLAAIGDRCVNAATFLVTMLDTGMPSMTGMFATRDGIAAAIARSRRKGVLEGAEMARAFAWMRPNDLVWNYWVNNYLMGEAPAPFDILYWNADSTALPARLHAAFLDLFLRNPLTRAGDLEVLGTRIDLQRVTCDLHLIAGLTDHICAWQSCYRSTRMFGGRVEFVLTGSGHVQSLVSPPGNPKARYHLNPKMPDSAEAFMEGATAHPGTWWEHWIEWIGRRSGDERGAPSSLGNDRYRPIEPAPGSYVRQVPD